MKTFRHLIFAFSFLLIFTAAQEALAQFPQSSPAPSWTDAYNLSASSFTTIDLDNCEYRLKAQSTGFTTYLTRHTPTFESEQGFQTTLLVFELSSYEVFILENRSLIEQGSFDAYKNAALNHKGERFTITVGKATTPFASAIVNAAVHYYQVGQIDGFEEKTLSKQQFTLQKRCSY